jgi:very-short-patch-repair endonuclease
MTLHFNQHREITKRRGLRKNATDAEHRLWSRLRGQQLGVKFRRQYSVDVYVLDFYAPGAKLAIEVDGASHFTPAGEDHDRARTEHLSRFGIKVVRVTNVDVLENLDGVVEAIMQALRRR